MDGWMDKDEWGLRWSRIEVEGGLGILLNVGGIWMILWTDTLPALLFVYIECTDLGNIGSTHQHIWWKHWQYAWQHQKITSWWLLWWLIIISWLVYKMELLFCFVFIINIIILFFANGFIIIIISWIVVVVVREVVLFWYYCLLLLL